MAIIYASYLPDLNYVTVINTEKVCKTNAVIHVPSITGGKYQEEYLIHGIIKDRRRKEEKTEDPLGLPHVVVPFRELLTRGLMDWFPSLRGLKSGRRKPDTRASAFLPFLMSQDVRKVSVEEIRSYRHVGAAFGKEFSAVSRLSDYC